MCPSTHNNVRIRRLMMRCSPNAPGCMAGGAEPVGVICEDRADCAADAVCLARATRQRRRGELFIRIAVRERGSVGSHHLRCCFGCRQPCDQLDGGLSGRPSGVTATFGREHSPDLQDDRSRPRGSAAPGRAAWRQGCVQAVPGAIPPSGSPTSGS